MKSKLMTIAMMMAMLGISSCSKTDLYDEGKIAELEAAKQAELIEAYKKNFIETYGEIKPTQSWDFSSKDTYYNLPSYVQQARTRGEEASYTMTKSDNYLAVQQATLDKMHSVFKEGKDNRSMGKPFAMTVPDNAFTIMPIFMGQSGGDFDLYMHVEGIGDILVWRKWEDMQAKFKNKNDWQDLYTEEEKIVGYEFLFFFPKYEVVRESTTNGDNTVNATAIQSKYITFSGLPKGAKMYFYLKITSAAEGYNKKGESLGMVNNYMREYQFEKADLPTNLPGVTNPEVKIIGCEDASTSKSDNDFNDVVLLMYGEPYVPQSFEVTDLEMKEVKRYMIEDLGESDDTDFNDVVVDIVSTSKVEQTTSASGIVTYGDPVLQSRHAEIKALGGTLDFELNIGGTTWKKSSKFTPTDMINTRSDLNYNRVLDTIELPLSFNPASNDIKVTVYQKGSDKVSNVVNFPPNGSVPMIIAIDPIADWAPERVPFEFGKFVKE